MRIDWRWLALASLLLLMFGACGSSQHRVARAAVDPLDLLFPESGFAGAGMKFSQMKVDLPAQHLPDLGGYWVGVSVKQWHGQFIGQFISAREEVRPAADADQAADAFRDYDPRSLSLALSRREELVTEWEPYRAAGRPDQSEVHCGLALDAEQETRRCEHWIWWARYGQYTVRLQIDAGNEDVPLPKSTFMSIVDQVADHIGRTLVD